MKRILILALVSIPFLAISTNDGLRTVINLISCRFLKIGQAVSYSYFNLNPKIQ